MNWSLALLIALVLVAVTLLARSRQQAISDQKDAKHDDDDDMITLESDYQSGMGGGHYTSWKIPKDPQAYAKLFIPREKEK